MSIPSVVVFCQLNELCGRASAIISAISPNDLNTISKCLNLGTTLFTGAEKPLAVDTFK
jgi:hypothetical protein